MRTHADCNTNGTKDSVLCEHQAVRCLYGHFRLESIHKIVIGYQKNTLMTGNRMIIMTKGVGARSYVIDNLRI